MSLWIKIHSRIYKKIIKILKFYPKYDDIEIGKVPIRNRKYQLTQNIYKWKDQNAPSKNH